MAMALTREQLQTLLESILGNKNVYFQAPENLKMVYPCIRYERDTTWTQKADNQNYIRAPRYTLTFITRDPLSDTPLKLLDINTAMHVRRYVAEGLYHDVFNIY